MQTTETARIRYFCDMLIDRKRPVMLVGNAGTGKTVLLNDKVRNLPEDYMVTNVPFNFYTTSGMLQRVLEKPLEKKAGRNFGPPGTRKLIYFVDDMNMPEVLCFLLLQWFYTPSPSPPPSHTHNYAHTYTIMHTHTHAHTHTLWRNTVLFSWTSVRNVLFH